MKIIVTLSGNSERFTSKGYTIKSLIKIENRNVIDYVLDLYPSIKDEDFIFLVKNEDIETYSIDKAILSKKKSKIYGIEKNTKGPVFSISNIFKHIPDDEEIIISYCDLTQIWNFDKFLKFCKETDSDGCIVTHLGFQPHKLYNKSFAFLKVDGENVLKIQEKKPFSQASDEEPASNGIYYFKSGKIMKFYFEKLMKQNINVNGEYYVTLPYNLMIEDKLKVTHFSSDEYVCLGTPEDIICFQAWKNILDYNNADNSNIKEIFNFWKNFWKKYKNN